MMGMREADDEGKGKFEDKVVIITGGGRGIGRALAEALGKEGALVAVVARSRHELDATVASINAAGGRAFAYPVDVTDQHAVQQMVAAVEAQLGPIHLLVNNAGVGGTVGPIWEVDANEWWHCLHVNLLGSLLCAQGVLPYMIARRGGYIVNMSSGAARAPWRHVSAYAVSKAALERFSENLALETFEHNIPVFTVSPGLVRTAMTDRAVSPEWQKWDRTIPDLFAEGRAVSADLIVQLVLRLASGAADVLSGCHISVHDDVEEMVKRASEIQQDALYKLRIARLPAGTDDV